MREKYILDFIPLGEKNAVRAAVICARFGLKDRELRKLFERLRKSGEVICSCDSGYFKPAELAELAAYIGREQARSRSIALSLRSAKRLLKEWGEAD